MKERQRYIFIGLILSSTLKTRCVATCRDSEAETTEKIRLEIKKPSGDTFYFFILGRRFMFIL